MKFRGLRENNSGYTYTNDTNKIVELIYFNIATESCPYLPKFERLIRELDSNGFQIDIDGTGIKIEFNEYKLKTLKNILFKFDNIELPNVTDVTKFTGENIRGRIQVHINIDGDKVYKSYIWLQ